MQRFNIMATCNDSISYASSKEEDGNMTKCGNYFSDIMYMLQHNFCILIIFHTFLTITKSEINVEIE